MPYNASLHSLSPKPIGYSQAVPGDARSYFYDTTLFKYRPYQSTAEVLNYLPTAVTRSGHFPIYINVGGSLDGSGNFTGGHIMEYWFKHGTGNNHLTVKDDFGSGLRINIEDRGAVGDGATDNLGLIEDLIDEAYTDRKELLIPPGDFECSAQLTITKAGTIIKGISPLWCRLVFPSSAGVKTLANKCMLKRIGIHGSYEAQAEEYDDDIRHGLWLASADNTAINIVTAQFPGNGIQVYGDTNNIPPTNANINKVYGAHTYYNGKHGLYVKGGDSGGGTYLSINSELNARWNIWCETFLYSEHISYHTASAGRTTINQTLVSHGGFRWYAYEDSVELDPIGAPGVFTNNINIEPGVHPSWSRFWKLGENGGIGGVDSFYKAWNNAQLYKSGGGVFLVGSGEGNQSKISGYSEGDQVRIYRKETGATIFGHAAEHGYGPGTFGMDKDGFLRTQSISFGNAPPTEGMYRTGNIIIGFSTVGGQLVIWRCSADSQVTALKPYGDGGTWVQYGVDQIPT